MASSVGGGFGFLEAQNINFEYIVSLSLLGAPIKTIDFYLID